MLLQPLVIAQFLAGLEQGILDTAGVARLMGLYIACEAGFWIFHFPVRVIEETNAFTIRARFRSHLFYVLTELPLSWHRNRQSGDSIDKAGKAAQGLYSFATSGYVLVYLVVRAVGAFIALCWFMPEAAAVAAGVASLALGGVLYADRIYIAIRRQINAAEHKVTARLFDYLSNISTVITLRLESRTRARIEESLFVALPLVRRNQVINEIKWWSICLAITLLIAVVMVLKTYLDISRNVPLQVGTLYVLFEYLRRLGFSFYEFTWKWSELVNQGTDVAAVDEILHDYHRLVVQRPQATLPVGWRGVELQNVSFRFDDAQGESGTIDRVSLSLERGRRYGFVGESGSGKSTMLRLIRGVLQPEEGEVRVDGVCSSFAALAGTTTLIPQDPEI
jgi:ABC-type multidrug transport system fused ATPase/permease subunit